MADPFLVFYITHPDEATARRIAGDLLQQKLIACANIFPVASSYRWEGAIAGEEEWVSIVKTRLSLEAAVEAAVTAIHPYQTPCLMRFEARANREYVQWIEDSTSGGSPDGAPLA